MELLSLGPAEAHVWHVFFDQVTDAGLLARYLEVLSPAERTRQQRFLLEKHRHQYLVSHALLRWGLSLYASVPPEEWTFTTNAHGKPSIVRPEGVAPLRFNLTHTAGLAALVVAHGREVGVDAENVERRTVGLPLAERYFAPSETARLRSLPASAFQEAFFDYWTLKEAFIKGVGLGLALPLGSFAFHLEADGLATVTFTARIADDPANWQFARFRPSPVHKLAVAIQRPGVPDLSIVVRPIVPLTPPQKESE